METIRSIIHTRALHVAGKKLKQEGIYVYARPVARKHARELIDLGYSCKAVDEFTVRYAPVYLDCNVHQRINWKANLQRAGLFSKTPFYSTRGSLIAETPDSWTDILLRPANPKNYLH